MKKERVFWGSILVLGAIALILNKLGYFAHINVFSALLAIALLGISIKSLFRLNYAGVLFPLAFICIIYDDQLGITAITPWTILLAALLGSIGLSMIFYKKPKWYYEKYNYKYGYNYDNEYKNNWDNYDYETINVEDDSHIRIGTSFSGSIKYINTDKFEQADLKCHFGSMKVYFDNAVLNNGRGLVRLDASFCGMELYIPKTWTVENKTNTSFGGVDEKNTNVPTYDNILTLVGDVSFSGVEIIYI